MQALITPCSQNQINNKKITQNFFPDEGFVNRKSVDLKKKFRNTVPGRLFRPLSPPRVIFLLVWFDSLGPSQQF